jgi:hypothetical protein
MFDLQGEFHVVNQDAELERLLSVYGLSWDTREHNPEQASRFTELRNEAANRTWSLVPDLRLRGEPIAFETTGDNPKLLALEIDLNRSAGYDNFGVGLCCSLADCLKQNSHRPRVLSEAVVAATWKAFHQQLAAGDYQALFGAGRFICLDHHEPMDIAAWVESQNQST